jgi:alkanesulfonate monooxygenase SsuD/methylene tetrahydromethanopterin reductase-like flavin-dependent oxidoreductase (luciferase family)
MIHLGLTPWVTDLSAAANRIAEQAETAEAMGYQSIWLPESHFLPRGACPAPLLVLAAAAARTRSLRLGTTSYLLPIRNPLQVAEEVAMLDRISDGRVILGLGRGFRKALFEAFKVPIRDKRDIFEASVATMIEAWSGRPICRDGEEPVCLSPLPVQEPHPPLWVAAFGPKAVTQAGRLGLPYLASPMESFERLEDNYRLHRSVLDENGVSPRAVPVMRTVFVSRNAGLVARVGDALTSQRQLLRRSASRLLREGADSTIDEWALLGEPERVSDVVEEHRERLGLTHLIVRGGLPEADDSDCLRSLELLRELFP